MKRRNYDDEGITKRIHLYTRRMENYEDIESHNPDDVSHWLIISGMKNMHGQRETFNSVVYGKFFDAVKYAVQQDDFYVGYPNMVSATEEESDDPKHWRNGMVIGVKISNLDDLLPK